jgi:hypothetical protein
LKAEEKRSRDRTGGKESERENAGFATCKKYQKVTFREE